MARIRKPWYFPIGKIVSAKMRTDQQPFVFTINQPLLALESQ